MSGLPASMKPISALDVCRLANTGKLNSMQNMRDVPIVRQQHIAPSSSMMYEDTDFIVPSSLSASIHNGSNTANSTGMEQPLPTAFQNQTRPLIYEDTDVFMMPALPVQQLYSAASGAPASAALFGPRVQDYSHSSSHHQQHLQNNMPSALQGTVDENAGFVKQHPAFMPPAQAHHSQPPQNMYYGAQHGTSRGLADPMPWGNPAASQMGIYEDTELLLQDRG